MYRWFGGSLGSSRRKRRGLNESIRVVSVSVSAAWGGELEQAAAGGWEVVLGPYSIVAYLENVREYSDARMDVGRIQVDSVQGVKRLTESARSVPGVSRTKQVAQADDGGDLLRVQLLVKLSCRSLTSRSGPLSLQMQAYSICDGHRCHRCHNNNRPKRVSHRRMMSGSTIAVRKQNYDELEKQLSMARLRLQKNARHMQE